MLNKEKPYQKRVNYFKITQKAVKVLAGKTGKITQPEVIHSRQTIDVLINKIKKKIR
jgi:hypothetical protein